MVSGDTSSVVTLSDGSATSTVDYDEPSGTYRAQFDLHTRSPSEAAVAAVATALGREPTEIPPLFSAVDGEALDALFRRGPDGVHGGNGTVVFEYADHRVTVHADGTVDVEPPGPLDE